MNDRLEHLLQRLAELQEQIETELSARRAQWRYRLENRRIVFEEGVREAHRAARVRLWEFLRHTRLSVVITAPLIYALILPFVLLDIFVSLYQAVCFPVYGIAKVKRSDHIVMDRQHLAYLNGLQKLNCLYCGYANGLIGYVREIAGRTEQYWCPIKHSRAVPGRHENYAQFVDYGDAIGFRERSPTLRAALGPEQKTGEAKTDLPPAP